MAGVFWVGADGNTYMKGSELGGTVKWIAPLKTPQQLGYTQIPDPVNPPSVLGASTSAPSGGGAAAAAPPALNEGAVRNTQTTIDQIPGILQAALASEGQRYDNTVGGFNAQEGQQRGTYDKSTETNQLNYDANFMDSIRAGIKGLGGLMAILRGSGASGGSVEGDVRDVVGGVTAGDIRGGADTQKENQGQLDSSLSTFLTDLGLKRRQNEDVRVNNERALRRDSNTQLQDLYGKMAGYYGDAGRTAERDTFMSRAGSLTPSIAADSASRVSAYDQTPVVVHAPNLTAFAEPSQPNAVVAPSDGQVGSGIFSISDRRRTKEASTPQAPALAGV